VSDDITSSCLTCVPQWQSAYPAGAVALYCSEPQTCPFPTLLLRAVCPRSRHPSESLVHRLVVDAVCLLTRQWHAAYGRRGYVDAVPDLDRPLYIHSDASDI